MPCRSSRPIVLLACAAMLLMIASPTLAVDAKPASKPAPPAKPVQWYTAWLQASAEARKSDKLILAYCCGSDWDEWTQKLDKEVMNTEPFRQWAEKNVILFKCDYLKFKSGGPNAKEQGDKFKIKYNLSKIPTILFLDCDGLLISRCGYDTASLREEEERGNPKAFVAYCQETLDNRPPKESVANMKSLQDAITYSKKRFMPVLFLIKGEKNTIMAQKQQADLLKIQPFVRFVNQNFIFFQFDAPPETDKSAQATELRKFMADNKLSPTTPLQLIVYDWYKTNNEIRERIFAFTLQDIDPLIEKLDKWVPNPDYNGRWLDDMKEAKFISSRLKRPLFICFTDDKEYTQKFFTETFDTPVFKQYVKQNLVLMRVDFPTDAAKLKEQSDDLKEQNRNLADTFAIRGYPTVVILNFMGQRIGDAKYRPQPVDSFIKSLDAVVKSDRFSRP